MIGVELMQLDRGIGLPLSYSGTFASSKVTDTKVTLPSANSILIMVLSGANIVL